MIDNQLLNKHIQTLALQQALSIELQSLKSEFTQKQLEWASLNKDAYFN